MPQISVVVPVYKVESYLDRCVQSILNQTFTDFELILVDDGSPDGCPAMCDEYAKKDSRVVVIHQENGGLSAARNAGIDWAFENSDSEWLTFIDSDDWVHVDMLKVLYEEAVQNNVDISICDFYRLSQVAPFVDFIELNTQVMTPEDFYVHRLRLADIAVGKLYKRRLFESIRYPLSYLFEDSWVTYRLVFSLDRVAVIDKELYCYFINENSISQAKWTVGCMREIEAHEQQLLFFAKNHYSRALTKSIECYLYILMKQLTSIEQSATPLWKYKAIIQRKMRKALKRYKLFLSPAYYQGVWERCHPILLRLLNMGSWIKHKLVYYKSK